jgi:hypothetical protein
MRTLQDFLSVAYFLAQIVLGFSGTALPVDVENGEYVVTDADGRPLSASVITIDNHTFFGFFKVKVKKVRLLST